MPVLFVHVGLWVMQFINAQGVSAGLSQGSKYAFPAPPDGRGVMQ